MIKHKWWKGIPFSAGFFPMFNRNKKSIAINLHSAQGAEVARKLALSADVVLENFKPDTMAKYGLDYAALSAQNPKLIYVSHKGFLPGPYEHRTALDEVVQMMGGLAYMTGRPGDPLRAGTSVNDIMGGMFGAIGALGALIRHDRPRRSADARTYLALGGVRRVHRQRRRADFSISRKRRAVGHLLRCAGLGRPEGRCALWQQQRPGA